MAPDSAATVTLEVKRAPTMEPVQTPNWRRFILNMNLCSESFFISALACRTKRSYGHDLMPHSFRPIWEGRELREIRRLVLDDDSRREVPGDPFEAVI